MRISHVLHGTRPVTAELACRFGKAFGQTPQYWLNLQADFDLKTVSNDLLHSLSRISQIWETLETA